MKKSTTKEQKPDWVQRVMNTYNADYYAMLEDAGLTRDEPYPLSPALERLTAMNILDWLGVIDPQTRNRAEEAAADALAGQGKGDFLAPLSATMHNHLRHRITRIPGEQHYANLLVESGLGTYVTTDEERVLLTRYLGAIAMSAMGLNASMEFNASIDFRAELMANGKPYGGSIERFEKAARALFHGHLSEPSRGAVLG